MYYDEIQLKDNTYYKISFDAVSNENNPSIYMDFYGNQYDSPAQNYKIRIEEGENSYTCYIFSGNLSADEQGSFQDCRNSRFKYSNKKPSNNRNGYFI